MVRGIRSSVEIFGPTHIWLALNSRISQTGHPRVTLNSRDTYPFLLIYN